MATLEIPLRNDVKAYRFTIELESTIYLFSLRYNSRMGRWILDILTPSQILLVGGIPLLTNVDLIARFKNVLLPQGVLGVVDETGAGRNPGYENLGDDIKLYYVESTDL